MYRISIKTIPTNHRVSIKADKFSASHVLHTARGPTLELPEARFCDTLFLAYSCCLHLPDALIKQLMRRDKSQWPAKMKVPEPDPPSTLSEVTNRPTSCLFPCYKRVVKICVSYRSEQLYTQQVQWCRCSSCGRRSITSFRSFIYPTGPLAHGAPCNWHGQLCHAIIRLDKKSQSS